jgi:hypothetical protein
VASSSPASGWSVWLCSVPSCSGRRRCAHRSSTSRSARS